MWAVRGEVKLILERAGEGEILHWQEISTQGTGVGTRRKGSCSSAFRGYSAKEQHPVEDSKPDFSGCWAMEKNTAYLVLYLSD